MTLPIRLVTGGRDQHVTSKARGLSFTKTAPGGHHSARVRLIVAQRDWSDLGPADRLYIYDPRDGTTVWEGYTTNPTPTRSDTGEGYDLAALGGMTLASDDRRALVYIDQEQTWWRRNPSGAQPQSARTDWSTNPVSGLTGMMLGFQPGQPIGTGMLAEMGYYGFTESDMEFGAFYANGSDGTTDLGYEKRIAWSPPFASTYNGNLNTAGTLINIYVGAGIIPVGTTGLALELVRTGGATNVADDDHWSHYHLVKVLGRRRTQTGELVATDPSGPGGMIRNTHVLTHEVVADVVGRMLNQVDRAGASIDATSTVAIDQLAYRQPTTASNVFDDLMAQEPDFLWEILESNGRGHRFAWRRWSTTARYEVPVRDWSARGGDVALANRLTVSWTEATAAGNDQPTPRSITVVADVPRLGSRIVHAEPVTLPPGRGSLANAQRIGAELLAARADPPMAGTAVVRRPIVDRLTGRLVPPWRIEPGHLVRLRETGDVLRLTEMTYDDDAGTATLTLGEPSLTDDQRIARLTAVG